LIDEVAGTRVMRTSTPFCSSTSRMPLQWEIWRLDGLEKLLQMQDRLTEASWMGRGSQIPVSRGRTLLGSSACGLTISDLSAQEARLTFPPNVLNLLFECIGLIFLRQLTVYLFLIP
jgi:hypothetical protein